MRSRPVPRRVALALGGLSGLALLGACSQPTGSDSTDSPSEGQTMPTTPAAPDGIETIDLNQPVADAVAAFEQAAKDQDLNVFATIDHAAGAKDAGMELRPTTLVLIGNAKGGTPLMLDNQLMGLMLPLRVLFWEDEEGASHASYESMDSFAERFGLGEDSAKPRENISGMLPKLIDAAKG